MKIARLLSVLVVLGTWAIAAHAQTPIDPSSVIPDPTINFHRPDPTCDPGVCVDFAYTGANSASGGEIFFGTVTPLPIPPEYSCTYNGDPNACFVDLKYSTTDPPFPIDFLGVGFFITTPLCNGLDDCGPQTTFSIDATGIGNSFLLTVPTDLLSCTSPACPGGTISLEPIATTPEVGTALLYLTGLVSLVGFARKRFGADFLT
jgi:hypothetical protein